MKKLSSGPFTLLKTDEIIQFAKDNPWKPIWSEELIREFLTRLTSSTEMVFDFQLEGCRIATAVLIDKIQNPGNNACLEILGIRSKTDISTIYQSLIDLSKRLLQNLRSGIELTVHDSVTLPERFFITNQFVPYVHRRRLRR